MCSNTSPTYRGSKLLPAQENNVSLLHKVVEIVCGNVPRLSHPVVIDLDASGSMGMRVTESVRMDTASDDGSFGKHFGTDEDGEWDLCY